VDALLLGQPARPIYPEPPGAAGHDPAEIGIDREHLVGLRNWTGPRTIQGDTTFRGGVCYGAEKAALERFTQGLAEEVYEDNISVTCVSPSQVVATPGTIHHKLVTGPDDKTGEPVEWMAQSALILATEPLDKVTGLVTYSQVLLKNTASSKTAPG